MVIDFASLCWAVHIMEDKVYYGGIVLAESLYLQTFELTTVTARSALVTSFFRTRESRFHFNN